MRPGSRARDPDVGRLHRRLLLVFLLLALPTSMLFWQAWRQLEWEAWYQYRGQAEDLTRGIDRETAAAIAGADARDFSDFAFLRSAGGAGGDLVERSPLASWPVRDALPGVLGYFQVGPNGEFSTPLLPGPGLAPASLGIGADELDRRQALARQLQSVLADNRLLRDRGRTAPPAATDAPPGQPGDVADRVVVTASRAAPEAEAPAAAAPSPGVSSAAEADADTGRARDNEAYRQEVFDELNAPNRQLVPAAAEATPARKSADAYRKLEDLKLDEGLEKRSLARERRQPAAAPATLGEAKAPESDLPAGPAADSRADLAAPAEGFDTVRIDTFAGDIDGYEFSMLDSGHLVLFRKVWHDGRRYVQGMLLDRDGFIAGTVGRAFLGSALATMSDVVVGYGDDIIGVLGGTGAGGYAASTGALDGTLLYRGRLSAPFDRIELVFSIRRLPAGPGAGVLGWTAAVLTLVFALAYYALYRLGLGQVRLARQQQDFVSAVSHELRTPLTSIRMYGEMLREGWADEQKKRQYYDYICDESERLTRLISNVLQLARITRNEPQVEPKPVRVAELLDLVRSKVAQQVDRAGFALTTGTGPEAADLLVDVDADCFAQIVINLVDNAIKFSTRSGVRKIEIAAAAGARGTVTFSVRDYGPGIPKDQLRKIFRLFYRPESELTRETVGTGIGLAIVHQLAQAMGGSADAVNRDPGAEFRVTFPARSPRA